MLKSLNYGTKPAFLAAEEETKEASIFQGTLGPLSSLHEDTGKTEVSRGQMHTLREVYSPPALSLFCSPGEMPQGQMNRRPQCLNTSRIQVFDM